MLIIIILVLVEEWLTVIMQCFNYDDCNYYNWVFYNIYIYIYIMYYIYIYYIYRLLVKNRIYTLVKDIMMLVQLGF